MIALGCKIDEVRTDGDLRSLVRDLRVFKQLGAQAVEIPPHGLDLILNGKLREPLAREVKRILGDYPFRYSVHAPNPINLMDRQESALHESALEATLEFACLISAEVVVYHAGRFIPEERFPVIHLEAELEWIEKKRMWDLEVERLDRLAEMFPDLIIGIENARPYPDYSPYCYGERTDFLKEMILAVGKENVGVALDLGHLWMASRFHRFDPFAGACLLAPWVRHIHVHDNFGVAAYSHEKQQTHQIPLGRGDSHMPIGWGEIPFKELLGRLIPPFDGIMIVELRSRYYRFTGETLTALRQLIEALESSSREGKAQCVYA